MVFVLGEEKCLVLSIDYENIPTKSQETPLSTALGIDIFTTYELMKELVNRADGFKEAFE